MMVWPPIRIYCDNTYPKGLVQAERMADCGDAMQSWPEELDSWPLDPGNPDPLVPWVNIGLTIFSKRYLDYESLSIKIESPRTLFYLENGPEHGKPIKGIVESPTENA